MYNWKKDIASWQIKNTLYLSIPFTWLLPQARVMAKGHEGPVIVGGPAVDLMPDYLKYPTVELPYSPLNFHNPLATFTSRGCPNRCKFCAVPTIEGDLKEISDFPVRPVICDNNLLACSKPHFRNVIDKLSSLPFVDFNQGLEAKRFKKFHIRQMQKLKHVKLRFAFDHINQEAVVKDAVDLAKTFGISGSNIGVYVLVGFKDSPEEAKYKLDTLLKWGIRPNPMRYQPLDCLTKNSFVEKGWTRFELSKMIKYYSRLNWTSKIPYDEFNFKEEAETIFDVFA